MGKMEAAGEIVSRLAGNGWTAPQLNSSETLEERRKQIEKQIKRMHLSANQDPPGADRMRLLVEDALRLWKDIPGDRLSEAVEAGIVEAGNFLCTAGGVAKAWREKAHPKEIFQDFVALSKRDADMETILAKDRLPAGPAFSEAHPEEQKEAMRRMYESAGLPVPEHLA
jgi:hypothetical protein